MQRVKASPQTIYFRGYMMGFEWANDDSRKFLSRGYIDGNMTVEERTRNIAQAGEKSLGLEGT